MSTLDAMRCDVTKYTIEPIIFSDAFYTGCRQIPNSKLLPRAIYDVLAQHSNDLQWSLCCNQCRQALSCLWHGVSTASSDVDMVPPLIYTTRLLHVTAPARFCSILHVVPTHTRCISGAKRGFRENTRCAVQRCLS